MNLREVIAQLQAGMPEGSEHPAMMLDELGGIHEIKSVTFEPGSEFEGLPDGYPTTWIKTEEM